MAVDVKNEMQASPTKRLTPKQRAFLEWLALPKAARHPPTQGMLANQLGVTDRTLNNWKRKFDLSEKAARMAREAVTEHLPDIYAALIREAKSGKYRQIKLVLEMAGHYVEKKERKITGDVVVSWDDAPD